VAVCKSLRGQRWLFTIFFTVFACPHTVAVTTLLNALHAKNRCVNIDSLLLMMKKENQNAPSFHAAAMLAVFNFQSILAAMI